MVCFGQVLLKHAIPICFRIVLGYFHQQNGVAAAETTLACKPEIASVWPVEKNFTDLVLDNSFWISDLQTSIFNYLQ